MTERTIKPEDSQVQAERTTRPEDSPVHPELVVPESSHPELEEYAGGTIQARVGYIPAWLLIVYAVIFGWGLYYMTVYWGGVGPGHLH